MLNPAPVKRPIVQNRISRAGYWFIPASESQVFRQERLLKALNSVAFCLFSEETDDFNRTIEDALGILGRSINAGQVIVWKNYMENNCLRVSRFAGWNSPDLTNKASAAMEQPVVWDFPIEEILPNWEKIVEEQKPEYIICKNLHEPFRSIAVNKGIHSILLIPIFSKGHYWGFISFLNYSEERFYSSAEKELLRSGGILIASAIENSKNTMELQKDIEKARLTADPGRFSQMVFDLVHNTVKYISEGGKVSVNYNDSNAPAWHGKTILAVDDNACSRDMINVLLKKTGVTIETAANGAEAVAMFKENPGKYALILMDLEMPKMGGLDATREIRKLEADLRSQNDSNTSGQIHKVFEYTGSEALNFLKKAPELLEFFEIQTPQNPYTKEIPIIAMTTNVLPSDKKSCFDAGMNDHVAKPVLAGRLFEAMQVFM